MPTMTITQFTGRDFGTTFDEHLTSPFYQSHTSTDITFGTSGLPNLTTVLTGTGFVLSPAGVPTEGTVTGIQYFDSTSGLPGGLIAEISGISFDAAEFIDAIFISEFDDSAALDALIGEYDLVFDATAVTTEETEFYGTDFPLGDTAIAGAGGSFMELADFADTYVAGTGWDQISFNWEDGGSGAFVNLSTGAISDTWGNTETIVTDAGKRIEALRGSQYDDTLIGDGGDNHIRGLEGDDDLRGGTGNDTVRYDRDATYGGFAGVEINLEDGYAYDGFGDYDTLSGFENARGSDFDDIIEGDASDNDLRGLAGNDRIYGGAGNDTINPGSSNGYDVLELSEGDDTYIFSDSNEVDDFYSITGAGAPVPLTFDVNGVANTGTIYKGMLGTDTLIDVARPLNAGAIDGGLGLVGGDVDDYFKITNTADQWLQITGGSGDDTFEIVSGDYVRLSYLATEGSAYSFNGITANLAAGTVTGDAVIGTDTIIGTVWEIRATSYDDTLIGSAADESFISMQGDDTIDGGAGFDRVRYDRSGVDVVNVDLGSGTATGFWHGEFFTDTLSNIEWVRGSRDGADVLVGAAADERLQGRGGSDLLNGRAGNDRLEGDDGNDVLIGGLGDDELEGGSGDDVLSGNAGNDLLDGGDGFDTVSYADATGRVVVRLNVNADVGSGEGVDTFVSIENVIGSRFNDKITGDAGDNVLSGGDGNDVLIGLAGDDTLDGGIGDDELTGSGGDDTLSGGNGFDVIDGLGGADIIDGGNGNDTISAGNGLDTVNGGGGDDKIFGNSGADMIFGDNGADDIRAGTGADVIDGGNGNDVIRGGVGNDTIFGGAGNNTLYGGNGPASGDNKRDTFEFRADFFGGSTGFDIIKDWEDGRDKLDLSLSGYASFADVLADATDVGAHMQIDWDFGGILQIDNFSVAEFNSGDVLGF